MHIPSAAYAHLAHSPLSLAFFATPRIPAADVQHAVQFHDLLFHAQRVAQASLGDADDSPEWSEEDVVLLHWRLLLELRRLCDPQTPLEEKLDTLAWALTDPDLDDRPFSFANCLRVVGTSPLSPTPYFGLVQIEDIRNWLRTNARKWICATIAQYPEWVQTLIREQPDWVASKLAKNPQWINEQVKAHGPSAQTDLFGTLCAPLAS